MPVAGALGEPRRVEAKGGEFVMGHEDPSEIVVHLGDGVPHSIALEVMGNSVSGAVVGEWATKTTGRVGFDAKPGVGNPGVAPRAKDGEAARGGHLRGDFASVLEAIEEGRAGEIMRRSNELKESGSDVGW